MKVFHEVKAAVPGSRETGVRPGSSPISTFDLGINNTHGLQLGNPVKLGLQTRVRAATQPLSVLGQCGSKLALPLLATITEDGFHLQYSPSTSRELTIQNPSAIPSATQTMSTAATYSEKRSYRLVNPPVAVAQDNFVMLVVKDINKKDITISLPAESCRSWAPVSQEEWTGWILLFWSASALQRPGPGVALCIIRLENQPCCDDPTENKDGSKCSEQILPTTESPTMIAVPAPASPLPIPPASSGTTSSGPPSTPTSTTPRPSQSSPIGPAKSAVTPPIDFAPTDVL
ncbi:hypothetical protein B0H14DRAFT_2584890 [Mycena olivaceomarginata]|nr:hypothetical protein B0H14DRAFT_2584890 [Mycena olivaceomarginata]